MIESRTWFIVRRYGADTEAVDVRGTERLLAAAEDAGVEHFLYVSIVGHATADPSGRVAPVGGPEVLTVGEIVTAYRDARGWRRPVVRLPVPGRVTGAFRDGRAVCPDQAVGTVTWDASLDREYGSNQPSNTTHPGS